MITDDDSPAGRHWPGARNLFNLAELSGVAPARRRPIPDRLSRAPEALSRPAINVAAVRALVDEKRRAMSAAEWTKATEDGALVARGLRALKTMPDPQAAMPAFRRKLASVGVTESAIATIPLTWDPRLADVLIAAHGEIRKLPAPPSRARQTHAAQDGAGLLGAPRGTQDGAGLLGAPRHAQDGAGLFGAPRHAQDGAGLFGAPRHTQDGADEDWPDWMRERYGDPYLGRHIQLQ